MTESIASSDASNRILVDTNVLIYAVDPSSGDRHHRATELIRGLVERDALTVSAQVLNEFYNVATRASRRKLMSHDDAK
jgi:predicted nucleic acid-binding protein